MTAVIGWCVFLAAALAGLHATPVPPGEGVEPAFAAVRLVALGLGWYLVTVTVMGSLTRLIRAGAAVRVLDVVTLPFVRHFLDRAAGLALVATMVTPSAALAAERPAEPPPVMRLVEAPSGSGPVAAAPADEPAAPAAAGQAHVVRPGENCWSIASDVLQQRLGRPATTAEVAPFWEALITVNAARFRTGNPDLVFAGDELVLPTE